MSQIVDVRARRILDSRGNPTVEVEVVLNDGAAGRAGVPSGASTGSHEAREKRDGGVRYGGKDVTAAIAAVHDELAPALLGRDAREQEAIDADLRALDGSADKRRLGANAILGVSLAVARAAAESVGLPLYRYVGGTGARILPVPMMNIINGGAHADNPLDIQEFMILPLGAPDFDEALRCGSEVFHALKSRLKAAGQATGVGDEGGFAPALRNADEAIEFILEAIVHAGYTPGDDVALALDAAAGEFYRDGAYHIDGRTLDVAGLTAYWVDLVARYPLVSIEDGCSEDDVAGWQALTAALRGRCRTVGDDFFVTDPARLRTGIAAGAADALLVKPNQIGTLSETSEAVRIAHRAGYVSILSHRSGETEDTIIADLAVAFNCGLIKTGAPCRGERTAKYNRLLRIGEELGAAAQYAGRSALHP